MDEISKYGSKPGLNTIKNLLAEMGNPQNAHPVIQIAGTNGKGSAGAFLCTILLKAGLHVGRFFSPAVFERRETISFDGEMIPREAYAACVTKAAAAAEEMGKSAGTQEMCPTVFETETAAAFYWFSLKPCDLVIVETGMGGLLDATNVSEQQILAMITSISKDHMQYLGSTLSEIAAHKAGIIRRHGTVVSVRQQPEVTEVLVDRSRQLEADIEFTDAASLPDISLGLAGSFQRENAALALQAAMSLRKKGYSISDDEISRGLQDTKWHGRFEKIGSSPDFWIDGAHNPDGARRLREAFLQCCPDKKAQMIIGIFKDKETEEMCRILCDTAEAVYTVTPPGPRGLPAEELLKTVRNEMQKAGRNVPAVSCTSYEEAVSLAIRNAGTDGVILAWGSLSYLGEITRISFSLKDGAQNNG